MDSIFLFTLFRDPLHFFMVLVAVAFSVCLHEYFHARTAYFFGDHTAANQGHLTLNPLRQMGLYSIIMLVLLGICWGQVPVNPYILRQRSRWAYPLTSFAGPFANLLLFVLALVLYIVFIVFLGENGLGPLEFTFILGIYNFTLFVFNLLPVPGLDGWNILAYFCPKINSVNSEFAKGAMLLLILLVFFFVSYLFLVGGLIMTVAADFVLSHL